MKFHPVEVRRFQYPHKNDFQMLIQAVMNLMVVIGLIPVTGVTLPFLSYGGSSLLISMISIGIILNISKYSKLL